MLDRFFPLEAEDEPTRRSCPIVSFDSATVIASASEVARLRAAIREADGHSPTLLLGEEVEESEAAESPVGAFDSASRVILLTRLAEPADHAQDHGVHEALTTSSALLPSVSPWCHERGADVQPVAELTPQRRPAADETVRTRAVAPRPTRAVATVIRAVLLTIVAIGVGGSAGFYVALHFS